MVVMQTEKKIVFNCLTMLAIYQLCAAKTKVLNRVELFFYSALVQKCNLSINLILNGVILYVIEQKTVSQ